MMQYKIRNFITGLLSVAIMMFVSADMAQAQDMYSNTQTEDDVVDVIQQSNDHTIFASLLEESDKVDSLRQASSVTVLAPTDEALSNMDRDVNELKNNPQKLDNFIENHVENGNEARTNKQNMDRNQDRNKDKKDKKVMDASNGEVHSIDKVKKDKDKKDKQ